MVRDGFSCKTVFQRTQSDRNRRGDRKVFLVPSTLIADGISYEAPHP